MKHKNQILTYQHKNTKLIPVILTTLLLVPSLFSQEERTYERALSLYKQKNFEEAKAILQSRTQSQEATPNDFVLYCHTLYALNNTNGAIDSLFGALKLKPADPEIYIDLIRIHLSTNRYKGALELIETAEGKFPDSKEIKLQKAFLLGKYGKVNTALGIIESLKQNSPNDPRPLAIESNLYFLQGDMDKAEMSLKWAISLQETSPYYHNNLSLIYEKMAENSMKAGNKLKARTDLEEAQKEIQRAISLKSFPQMLETQKRIQEKLAAL